MQKVEDDWDTKSVREPELLHPPPPPPPNCDAMCYNEDFNTTSRTPSERQMFQFIKFNLLCLVWTASNICGASRHKMLLVQIGWIYYKRFVRIRSRLNVAYLFAYVIDVGHVHVNLTPWSREEL